MSVAAHWPESEEDRIQYVRWLRDAYARLALDAQQWFEDEASTLHDTIRDLASRVQALGTTTAPDDIQTFVLRYNQLRSALLADGTAAAPGGEGQSAVRSAPLIDAAVPWVTTDHPAPSDSLGGTGTSWGTAIAQARTIYPADDATRQAIEQWAEEYRSGAGEHAFDDHWISRYERLLAFVRSRMRTDDSSSLGRTGPTAEMPASAGGLTPAERAARRTPAPPRRSAGRSGGGALAILLVLLLATKRKRARA